MLYSINVSDTELEGFNISNTKLKTLYQHKVVCIYFNNAKSTISVCMHNEIVHFTLHNRNHLSSFFYMSLCWHCHSVQWTKLAKAPWYNIWLAHICMQIRNVFMKMLETGFNKVTFIGSQRRVLGKYALCTCNDLFIPHASSILVMYWWILLLFPFSALFSTYTKWIRPLLL